MPKALLIDTESTQSEKAADVGLIITNEKGEILESAAVLIRDFYLDNENHPLFHFSGDSDPLWGKKNLPRRYADYDAMLGDGRRMLASVPAVNRWLAKAKAKYNPIATAYNKSFDWRILRNSGIDIDLFDKSFCLWHAAANKHIKTKAFRQFVLDNHCFNAPTKHGNMSFLTNAEIMARFVLNDPDLPDEPHTAFEDARDYELPILVDIFKSRRKSAYMDAPPYNWRNVQVKDWFKPR